MGNTVGLKIDSYEIHLMRDEEKWNILNI
jgi:hypothetical protein